MTQVILTQLIFILKMRMKEAKNTLKSLARENADFKMLVVGSCFLLILLLGFFIAYRGFYFIQVFPGIGPLLMDRVLFLLFFAMFVMLVSSNIVVGYSTFYKSKEVEALFTVPFELDTVFIYKFLECILLSSWAPLFLTTPIIIAFGLVREVPLLFYTMFFISFIPFLIIAGVIGVLFLSLIMRFLPLIRIKIGVIPVFIILGAGISFWLRIPSSNRITSADAAYLINNLLKHTSFSQSPFFPSYWISKILLSVSGDVFRTGFFYSMVLLSNMLMVVQTGLYFAKKLFHSGWGIFTGSGREKYTKKGRVVWKVWEALLWFLRPSTRSLVLKDIKVFKRDPAQWSQVVMFFGILGLYIINLRTLPYSIDSPFWKNMVAFLNLAATALTMSMLNIRFIFPLISLEGQRFWILGLSPISTERLLMEKFWFSATASLLITEVLIITSNFMLKITGGLMLSSIFSVFMMCFAISGLSVGMSAIYPNFKTNNPAKIVSGFGGTLLLVLSLLYVFTVISLEVSPVYWHITGQITGIVALRQSLIATSSIILIISIVTCIIPMKLGIQALKNAEF